MKQGSGITFISKADEILRIVDSQEGASKDALRMIAADILSKPYQESVDDGVDVKTEIERLRNLSIQGVIALDVLSNATTALKALEQEGEGGLLQTSSSSRGSSIAFRDMSDGSGKRARRTSKVTSVVIVACVLVAAAALLPRFFPFGTTQSPTANGAASASTNDGGFIGDLIRMIPGYGTGRDAGGATKNEAKPIAYADLFNGLTNLRGLWFEFTGEVMTDEGGGVFCVNVTKDESEVMGAFMPYKDSVALYVEGAADFHVGDIIHFVGQSDGSIADSSLGSSVRMPKIIAAATDISVE